MLLNTIFSCSPTPHLCACSELLSFPLSFSPSLWLYLCSGPHLIMIRSDSTRPLTVYCSCSTSVGLSHWQLEDTFHIVLGLRFGVSCIAAHTTHSFFSPFSVCVKWTWNKHCLKHTHMPTSLLASLRPSWSHRHKVQHVSAFVGFFLESETC